MKSSRRACGKRRFRDHAEAVAALHKFENTSTRDVIPVRAYRCDFCRGWHLTSRPQPGGHS